MKPAELLRFLGVDTVYGLDAETFWSNEYTLKKQSTTEYIVDPRFRLHMMSVQQLGQKRAKVMSAPEFGAWVKTVNWKHTAMLAHHTQFDGFILSHHFGVHPAVMLDTMSMGRPLLPITVGDSLDGMCRAFGLKGKQGGEILVETKGKEVLTASEFRQMARYAGNDIEQTWQLFWKLLPYLPPDELEVIDLTVKMFTAPTLRIDEAKVRAVAAGEAERKASLVKKLKLTRDTLSKNALFIPKLEALGVEVPMKLSPSVRKRMPEGYIPTREDFVPALSKQDLAFKNLLQHPDKRVRALVEARFAIKSTNLEKKSEKLAERAVLGAVPVYLKYAGAKTLRWTGKGDKINWQNMNRGSDMRRAVHAPPGYTLIVLDQMQIEARFNAWYSGQDDKVELYRQKKDVYKLGAVRIYGKPLEAITADERFVSKTCELGLGYQAGGPRLGEMLRVGQFGPPVDITDAQANDIKTAWRQANHMIVRGWKETQNLVKSAFIGRQRIEHKHGVVYEGVGNVGFIHHLPTGLSMRYDGLEVDEAGNLTYVSEYRRRYRDEPRIERTKLYGGLEVENRTQFICRNSVAANAIQIKREMPKVRIANTTHDELLLVVPVKLADRTLRRAIEIMSEPPVWASGMPFAVDAHVTDFYDKK